MEVPRQNRIATPVAVPSAGVPSTYTYAPPIVEGPHHSQIEPLGTRVMEEVEPEVITPEVITSPLDERDEQSGRGDRNSGHDLDTPAFLRRERHLFQ